MFEQLEPLFEDRADAGRQLAQVLMHYAGQPDVMVLALPRGGVPIGYEVARALHAPLEVFIVRKLGVPGHPELAMGAIATGGVRVLNRDVVNSLAIPGYLIQQAVERETQELERRERLYRDDRPLPQLRDRTAILVDDGLATGSTMQAAIQAVREQQPRRIVVAVPTAAAETCDELREQVDEVVCATTPQPFFAVGQAYVHFDQTTDQQVRDLLRQANTVEATERS